MDRQGRRPSRIPSKRGEFRGESVGEGAESGLWNSEVVVAFVYGLVHCSHCTACSVKNSPNTPDRKKPAIKALITLMVLNEVAYLNKGTWLVPS